VRITAGSWKSRGVSYAYGTSTEIHSDAIVFATPDDAEKTVAVYTAPRVVGCLKHAFQRAFRNGKSVDLRRISTSVLHRHRVADDLAAFRLTFKLAKDGRAYKYFLDTFFIRQDRAVAEFIYGQAFQPAPSRAEDLLARTIAQRGALSQPTD
jgi:hypothetical protein